MNDDNVVEFDKSLDFTEEMKNHFKDLLTEGVVNVSFKKTDGSTRVMRATLKKDTLPVVDTSKPKKTVKKSPEVICVFDVENNGWRSFRWNSIVSYHLEEI